MDKAGNEEETKEINFKIVEPTAEYLLDKINKLYGQGEIYKLAVKNYFDAQLNMVIKKQEEKAGDKIIKQKYLEMLKMLETYQVKYWLSQSAYDIIKIGLINLRDK